VLGEDVLYLPVEELSARIRARKLSPVELTESYLARIERLNPRLRAFETVLEDLARREARQAERDIGRGRWRGVLHGIPYAAKDLFATAGTPTRWGAAPCRDQVFDTDATVVARLRTAGAVLLGKTAMIEFAGGLGYRFPDASASGACANPHDLGHWSGGSSSGSGSAVAAGLCAFALGTETWGSILCPAAFCGITGLRPTYGRVSRAGAMVCAWSFDKVGPLARSAADARLVLEAIAGPDPADPTCSTEPLSRERPKRGPGSLKAGVFMPDFDRHGEAEVKRAFEDAVEEVARLGVRMSEIRLPDLPASEVAGVLITAEALSSFERFYQDGSVRQLSDPYAPFQPEINRPITGADVVKAWRIRRVLQEQVAQLFESVDLVLAPNFMSVAPQLQEDLFQALAYADPLGAIGNSCGLPALAMPSGAGRKGLPVGFQMVAAPFEEAMLLDLGERYQKRTRWHQRHPALAGDPVPAHR
jgi:aspartyl-tRNA(Asn)/glutamyl-tRNA(Gln) amidotransferase subunit A